MISENYRNSESTKNVERNKTLLLLLLLLMLMGVGRKDQRFLLFHGFISSVVNLCKTKSQFNIFIIDVIAQWHIIFIEMFIIMHFNRLVNGHSYTFAGDIIHLSSSQCLYEKLAKRVCFSPFSFPFEIRKAESLDNLRSLLCTSGFQSIYIFIWENF